MDLAAIWHVKSSPRFAGLWDQTCIHCIGGILNHWTTTEVQYCFSFLSFLKMKHPKFCHHWFCHSHQSICCSHSLEHFPWANMIFSLISVSYLHICQKAFPDKLLTTIFFLSFILFYFSLMALISIWKYRVYLFVCLFHPLIHCFVTSMYLKIV